MRKGNRIRPRTFLCIALLVLIGISVFAGCIYDPGRMLVKLDGQMTTALELTASTATASAVIAVIPDDSTTPVANQIAEVASYMTIACTAILLEKFIVSIAGTVSLWALIPVGLALTMIACLVHRKSISALGVRIIAAGLAILLVVPVSLFFDDKVDEVLNTQAMIEQCSDIAANDLQLGWDVIGSVMDAIITKVNHVITLVAVKLLTCCVVPILSMIMLFSLLKWALAGFGDFLPALLFDDRRHPERPSLPEGRPAKESELMNP